MSPHLLFRGIHHEAASAQEALREKGIRGWHFCQQGTWAELDLAFGLLEKADRNLATDSGLSYPS